MRGSSPPSLTMRSLLSAAERGEVATSDKLHGPRQRVLLRTINGQITQRRACSPLHFGVMAAEEEEDGVERVAANRANFLLGNFGKCKCGAALEVDVVRKRECSQRCKRRIPEEVGRRAVCSIREGGAG